MPTPYQTLIEADASIIHHWRMDETVAGAVTDWIGSLPGTRSGSSPPTINQAGLPSGGTSYLFNGGGSRGVSFISVGSHSTGGTGISVEAWLYIASDPGTLTFVAGWTSAGADSGEMYLDATRTPKFYLFAGSAVTITGTAPLGLNTWHHLVGVAPTSGTAHLYVDGVAQTAGTAIGTPYNVGNSLPFQIGGEAHSGQVGADTGVKDATYRIDEVATYSSGLSGPTVLAHYNAGLATGLSTRYAPTGPSHPMGWPSGAGSY